MYSRDRTAANDRQGRQVFVIALILVTISLTILSSLALVLKKSPDLFFAAFISLGVQIGYYMQLKTL